jgi:hypothetical protein
MITFVLKLVWTPCLMHRCVCIWRYILQNYNYKLHFQNLSIYHIPHVSIGTLAAENFDVCIACDPWDSNIQLTMVKDQRPGPGMPFLHSDTCAEGGLIISAMVFFLVWCHPWMDDGMDGWTGHDMTSMEGWRDEWMDGQVTWFHPWMDDGTNGWMKKLHELDILYYM